MPNVDCNVLSKEADFDVTRGDPGIVCSASCCEDRNRIPKFVSDESDSECSAEMFRGDTSESENSVSGGRFTRR